MTTYMLSIETAPGESRIDGFHLGSDLSIAKKIAEERFEANHKIWLSAAVVSGTGRSRKIHRVFDSRDIRRT